MSSNESHTFSATLDSGNYTFSDIEILRYTGGESQYDLSTADSSELFTVDLDTPPILAPPILSTSASFEASVVGLRERGGAFLDILVSSVGGAGSDTITVSVDGTEYRSVSYDLGSGKYTFFEVDITDTNVGTHTVSVSNSSGDSTTVDVERTAEILYEKPSFGGTPYIDATITNTVETDNGMECSVLVTNSAGSETRTTVSLLDDSGGQYDDSSVLVDSGEFVFTTLVVPPQSEGTYGVSLETVDETEEAAITFTNAVLKMPNPPDADSYFDATILEAVPTATHTTIYTMVANSGGFSDQTDVWIEDSRGSELAATTTSLIDAGTYSIVELDVTDMSGRTTITLQTIDDSETADIVLGNPTMIERQVSGGITVPEDEGTGLSEDEADWASAGHVGAMTGRMNASDYVEHGMVINYNTDDTIEITGGLGFVHVSDNISVQDNDGEYTRRWTSGITVATELPTVQGIEVYEDVTNYVYLALDMNTNNGASYFVAEGSNETPSDPHFLIGIVDLSGSSPTVTQVNRAPDIVADSLTANSAEIDEMTFEDITANTINASSITTDSLDITDFVVDTLDVRRINSDEHVGTDAQLAVADIDNLTAQLITATTAEIASATIEELSGGTADFEEIIADRIEARNELQLPVTDGYSDSGHGRLYVKPE